MRRALRSDADEIVCFEIPEDFFAVGQLYRDFQQVSDQVKASLKKDKCAETHQQA